MATGEYLNVGDTRRKENEWANGVGGDDKHLIISYRGINSYYTIFNWHENLQLAVTSLFVDDETAGGSFWEYYGIGED